MIDFPASPTVGQKFSSGTTTWAWDGTAWNIVPVTMAAIATDTAPPNPAVGQFWFRTTNGQLYVYVDDGNTKQWVQAAGSTQTPPGVWENIKVTQPNGSSGAVVIKDLGVYIALRFKVCVGANPSAAGIFLVMQVSIDNGASFIGTTSYFSEFHFGNQQPGAAGAPAYMGNISGQWIPLSLDSGLIGLGQGLFTANIDMMLFNQGGHWLKTIWNGGFQSGFGADWIAMQGYNTFQDSTARNAVRFSLSGSGNTMNGLIIAEGYRG